MRMEQIRQLQSSVALTVSEEIQSSREQVSP